MKKKTSLLVGTTALIATLGSPLLGGCGAFMTHRYDTLIVVDSSASTVGDEEFAQTLRGVAQTYMSLLRVGAKNSIVLRHGGNVKKLEGDGKGISMKTLKEELLKLADEKSAKAPGTEQKLAFAAACNQARRYGQHSKASHHAIEYAPVKTDEALPNGSRIVETILEPVRSWIKQRPAKNELMVVIVSDGVADPTMFRDGCVQWHKDPAVFRWGLDKATNVHLRFYMTSEDTSEHLRASWKDAPADLRFFEPGHTVDKSDLEPATGSQ